LKGRKVSVQLEGFKHLRVSKSTVLTGWVKVQAPFLFTSGRKGVMPAPWHLLTASTKSSQNWILSCEASMGLFSLPIPNGKEWRKTLRACEIWSKTFKSKIAIWGKIEIVLQYNTRDLPNVAPIVYLEYVLNNREKRLQRFDTIAGTGVMSSRRSIRLPNYSSASY
jgi:hypothetical protein